MSNLDPGMALRLVRLLGMLGSVHDGEALNAARMVDRFLRERGLIWPQIIPVPGRLPETALEWRDLARTIQTKHPHQLNPRELQFVDHMINWRGIPTEKQQKWLLAINERVTEGRP